MKLGISMGKILNKIPKKKKYTLMKMPRAYVKQRKKLHCKKKRLKRKEQIIKLTPKLIYWFKKKKTPVEISKKFFSN